MNDGFFTSSQMNKFIKLPPRLQVEFPVKEGSKSISKTIVDVKSNIMFMDIESYVNYFLIKFRRYSDKALFEFERTDYQELDYKGVENIVKKYEIITFNGNKFDILILKLALEGATCKELKEACNELIQTKMQPWRFEKKHNLPKLKMNHIDLIEIPKGIVSLKIYGGRLHCQKMQDLPYPEDSVLTENGMDRVCDYCGNDLAVTELVFENLPKQIELRRIMSKRYKIDLMSKSDAQIAEAVIKKEYERLKGIEAEYNPNVKTSFYYKAPEFIKFINPKLQEALHIVTTKPFTIGNDGKPIAPTELTGLKIKIGFTTYTMGRGGLHSTEKNTFHISDNKHSLWDWDVASYYPAVILNCGLYPRSLGKIFLQIYQTIVTERLEAKKAKNKEKAETMKIIINGSFGKLGQEYSILYAPDLLLQVTLTGQLAVLMLIDTMEQFEIPVVSGNTDGIVIKCPKDREDVMQSIIKRWEAQTGFELESTQYAGIYSRDVNDYIAISADSSFKGRGIFRVPHLDKNPMPLEKNPENEICTLAMIEYLKYGTPIEKTIKACTDITKFVTIRHVEGGAIKNNEFLGKAIRFYHAKNEAGCIQYKNNGNKVPLTDGCLPLMELPNIFPNNVDYDYYETRCREMFK